jgi:predicted transcriptional regulator
MQTVARMPDTIAIRLTSAHAAKLRALAAADDRRPSALARRLLVDALAQLKNPKNTEAPVS